MRLFRFDVSEVAAISDKGLAKLLVGSDWRPSEPSRAMALEVLADERAFELSAEEAAEVLAARGAPMPDF
jgi:hypothetical protein